MSLPQKRTSLLPNTIKDLNRFILVKEQELQAHIRLVMALDKLPDASDAYKAAVIDAQNLGDLVIKANINLGELLAALPKKREKESSSQRTSLPSLPPGISKKESHKAQRLAKDKNLTEQISVAIKNRGEIPTPNRIYSTISRRNRKEAKQKITFEVKSGFEVCTEKDIDDAKKQVRKIGVARIEADRIPDAVQSIRLAFSDKEIKDLINGLVRLLKTQPEDQGESS